MPNCIAFTDRHTKDAVTFAEIDDALCVHLGVVPDQDKFYRSWYDIIGYGLACGKSLDWFLGYYWLDPNYGPIANFLWLNYTSEAWYSPR